jgi:hypothetical protein
MSLRNRGSLKSSLRKHGSLTCMKIHTAAVMGILKGKSETRMGSLKLRRKSEIRAASLNLGWLV